MLSTRMPQTENLIERYIDQRNEKKTVIIQSSSTIIPYHTTLTPTVTIPKSTQPPSSLALHHLQLLLPPFAPSTDSVSLQHLRSTLQPIVRTQRTTSSHSNHKKKGRRRKNRQHRRQRNHYTPELRTWSDRIPKHILSTTFRDRNNNMDEDELLESANNVAFAISLRTSTNFSNNTRPNVVHDTDKIKSKTNRGHIKFHSNETIDSKLNRTVEKFSVFTESSVVTTFKEIQFNSTIPNSTPDLTPTQTSSMQSLITSEVSKNSIDYQDQQESNSLEIIEMDE